MDRSFLILVGAASAATFAGTWLLAPSAQRHPSTQARTVLFHRCAEAFAAGAAPIYRGQPSYRSVLDADDDGIACEPYRPDGLRLR